MVKKGELKFISGLARLSIKTGNFDKNIINEIKYLEDCRSSVWSHNMKRTNNPGEGVMESYFR